MKQRGKVLDALGLQVGCRNGDIKPADVVATVLDLRRRIEVGWVVPVPQITDAFCQVSPHLDENQLGKIAAEMMNIEATPSATGQRHDFDRLKRELRTTLDVRGLEAKQVQLGPITSRKK